MRVDLERGLWTTRHRIVHDVLSPASTAETLATFAVQGGRPGVVPV